MLWNNYFSHNNIQRVKRQQYKNCSNWEITTGLDQRYKMLRQCHGTPNGGIWIFPVIIISVIHHLHLLHWAVKINTHEKLHGTQDWVHMKISWVNFICVCWHVCVVWQGPRIPELELTRLTAPMHGAVLLKRSGISNYKSVETKQKWILLICLLSIIFLVFSVPPLEGFVMNRVQGDYFETLLYKIFVSIDEHTTVAEVSAIALHLTHLC